MNMFNNPALPSHTHYQADQSPSAIQSLLKSVPEPTRGRKRKLIYKLNGIVSIKI
tara:strand:+ start:2815 stop:2979 length:165 start_codon:yes stop_codon:yes gene_type:complete